MQEYDHLLDRLNDFLSYVEVTNTEDVISAYDYINLLRREYNKSKKVSVSESLVDRIDTGYELIQRRENRKDKIKREIDFIESIEVFTGKTISRIRIKTAKGESFICRHNESKEMFMTGMKLDYMFVARYLDEFNRLLDEVLPNNIFVINIKSYLAVILYYTLTYVIMMLTNYASYPISMLFRVYYSNIIMSIIYTTVSYIILNILTNKFNVKEIK